jgi:uncharacterized membrane protein
MNTRDKIFRGAVLVKGINGLIEILSSLFVFFFGSRAVVSLIEKVFSHELSHDPNDFILNLSINLFAGVGVGTQKFIAVYLGIHGLLNMLLFAAVWRRKISFYPFVIAIMLVFILYQIVRFSRTYSYVLFFLTLVDMAIVYFVADEYLKKRLHLRI